jgi:hypothetical protein
MPTGATLIVMRLAEMRRVHPAMTTDRVCAACGHQVGIYPSGQRLIAAHPAMRILCSHCEDPAHADGLAPGAEVEPFESEWRK